MPQLQLKGKKKKKKRRVVNSGFTVKRQGAPASAPVAVNAPADPNDNAIDQGLASLRDKGLTPEAPTGISSTRYSDTLDPAVEQNIKDTIAKDPDKEMMSEERRLDLRFNIEENAARREEQLQVLRDLTDFDYARRLKELELDNANITAKVDSLNKVSTLAGELYASVVKDKRAAIALATAIPQRNLEAYDRAYKVEVERRDKGVKSELEALKIEASNEFNKINAEIAKATNNTNKIKILDNAIDRNKKKIAVETARIEALPRYGMKLKTAKLASNRFNPDGTNQADESQRALIIQSLSDIQSSLEDLGYNKLQKRYEEILDGMVGV